MKRFYCTVCKKVKRVRNWPNQVSITPVNPTDRIGKCNKHKNESASVSFNRVMRLASFLGK